MTISAKFYPYDNGKLGKTPLGSYNFDGSDLNSIARAIAKKIQHFEAKVNDDPHGDREYTNDSPKINIGFAISKVSFTHIPAKYIQKDLNDLVDGMKTHGVWDFWQPR